MSSLEREQKNSLETEQKNTELVKCNVKGEIHDLNGEFVCKFTPIKNLGEGTFGYVDLFTRTDTNGESRTVAIKRPKFAEMKLLNEALFQKKLHEDLLPFGLSFCVPEVYDIFVYRVTGDVWFSMEPYEPLLLSVWAVQNIKKTKIFVLLILQIALILEVFQQELQVDHRDLKINNMLVLDKPVSINISWKNTERTLTFPFRIIFLDFGFACKNATEDIKHSLPELDACPKEGRDIFQILVSVWNNESLRNAMPGTWCSWIRKCISSIYPRNYPSLALTESNKPLNWMYTLTDDKYFRAPLCAPRRIIHDCMSVLEWI
jgi:serine/threonine protein kinase